MKILLIVLALANCEHEEDAELEESLDTCEEEICSAEDEATRAVCIGIRFDRRALDHESIIADEGKLRRVPISMTIIYKERLFEYYCRGELKDRVKRFDGVIHNDSELPAPKDASTNDKLNTSGGSSSSDRDIACQEEAKSRANGATRLPTFQHSDGHNCVGCSLERGGWDCVASG